MNNFQIKGIFKIKALVNYHFQRNDYLIFRGSERLDLINRLSTNQVDKLLQNQWIKTILTTDKGRFVDLITLYVFKDFVFTLCSYGFSERVKLHLNKYTIMDDFTCENISGTHGSLLLWGKEIKQFIDKVFSFSLAENEFKIIKENNHDILVSNNDDVFGGAIILYPIEAKTSIDRIIFQNKSLSTFELKNISDDGFDVFRIENGIPAIVSEMNDDTNPLECGLNKYVSFTKGCYIGQEVIARLDTYDKINKHLVGLKIEKDVETDLLGQDLKIMSEKNKCGYVTSLTKSKNFGNIGLGFVKTAFLDYDKTYSIEYGNEIVKCELIKLPFKK